MQAQFCGVRSTHAPSPPVVVPPPGYLQPPQTSVPTCAGGVGPTLMPLCDPLRREARPLIIIIIAPGCYRLPLCLPTGSPPWQESAGETEA